MGSTKKFTLFLCFFISTFSFAKELKVLSWNIFSLPSILGNKSVDKRAPLIVDALVKNNYDVILLQEAFNKETIKKLTSELPSSYPYYTKKPLSRLSNKTLLSSGLMIFSKYPISSLEFYPYKKCKALTADCFSDKGILYARLNIRGQLVDVFNTHLQSKKKAYKVKIAQLDILNFVMNYKKELNIPQIIAGDFNLDWFKIREQNQLLDKIKPVFKDVSGFPYSADSVENTLRDKKKVNRKRVDHIFLKENMSSFIFENYHIARFRGNFREDKMDDLSDHFMMRAIFSY